MEAQIPTILVVDDEVGMREGCRRALTSQGYRVTTAEHGAEGLRKLREASFDVALVDAMMPGMGGLELLNFICEQSPATACIMITGYATVDLAAQAMKQGAFDFLPKPFTLDELLTVVHRGLEEAQRRHAARGLQEREEEARQLERAKNEMDRLDAIESRFMLVMAHELRNPAGVIKNYMQYIRSGYMDADELEGCLDSINQRADQLLAMLDDILELAHLKEKQSPAKLQPVAADEVLDDVIQHYGPIAAAKGLDLVTVIHARPAVTANRAHLHSLWARLIDNAILYTPSGSVTVELDERPGRLLTSVADTGIGLSTEEISRIFQEFYRSEAAKELVELGTGLGLSIANQIVRAYGGHIAVDSAVGQGSTFSIELPLVACRIET